MTDNRFSILLVDDETNMRKIMTVTLQREGFDIIAVEDGAAALKVLAEQTHSGHHYRSENAGHRWNDPSS